MHTSFEEMGEPDLHTEMEAGGYTLLGAWNDPDGGYEDSLYAVLRKDDQLYEYEDSHCSCNGFEFNPQPVTKAYLKSRGRPKYYGSIPDGEFETLIAGISRLHVK